MSFLVSDVEPAENLAEGHCDTGYLFADLSGDLARNVTVKLKDGREYMLCLSIETVETSGCANRL